MEKVLTIGRISEIKQIHRSGMDLVQFVVKFKLSHNNFETKRYFATGWKVMVDKVLNTPEGTLVLVESEIGKVNTYKDSNGVEKASLSFNLKHIERLDDQHNPYSKYQDNVKREEDTNFELSDIFEEDEKDKWI